MPRPPSQHTLNELKAAVGTGSWFDSQADLAPYVVDFRRLYQGATPLVLMPRSVAEVSTILEICHRDEVAVVPHGGNTSYCGAATPDDSGSQIVLSMRRLNRVRRLDAVNYSMIVEAGATLAEVQAAARDADRLFPLSLGSEGTAQIGGNLSTNAGGTAVLRYGMMRDLVLGLEVVLADGRVMPMLKSLRKDNTGYDVKSLFVGAEGTLGVITAAALKLFPLPADTATALVGVDTPQHALDLLARLRTAAGDQVTTFELMPRLAVELTVKHIAGVANPLAHETAWYLLVELTSPNPRQNLVALLSEELQQAATDDLIQDALIATSIAQSLAMWKLRESVPEAQRHHGASLKHDISVPVSSVPKLIEDGSALVRRLAPEGEVVGYGHLGDGNLHFNVSQRPDADKAAFLGRGAQLERAIFDLVDSLGGSISAEHGIGRLKAAEFAQRADPVELAVMRDLKRALDPKGILNPGKVLA
ncbi:MAG TPA: FAD-binding oxidoreductase [Steroidobacteraceae bacterium]|nr:FAD-binding oxidoreductase [Steroidobacteraceae bacterium]